VDYAKYQRAYFVRPAPEQHFRFINSFGATLYFEDYEEAIAFYTNVLGRPRYVEGKSTRGWPIGAGWLTLLRGEHGNPQNVEITLELESVEKAEGLQRKFVSEGAKGQAPSDQLMYRPVRACPVVDPFGLEIMIIASLGREHVVG
jgi:uncharacterized glyoxalase superfamily protein PhnB